MVDMISTIYGIVALMVLVCLSISVFKGIDMAFDKHLEVCRAIYRYKIDCYNNDKYQDASLVNYEDVREVTMFDTFFPWRWRHKCYISEEKFELIKDYL